MSLRKVIKIDEEKCDGCGLCVPSCAEGALQIIDGKARLVSETFCDGLGACLGECPQNAITIEERESAAFDPEAVERHLAKQESIKKHAALPLPIEAEQKYPACPGSLSRSFKQETESAAPVSARTAIPRLGNWPVQLKLAPTTAPYFQKARLLIAADCVPFALPDFHERLLNGRTLLIGCPKLDETDLYLKKLTAIIRDNDIMGIEIAFMEVPCCFGLVQLVQMARQQAGKEIPLSFIKIGIRGEIIARPISQFQGGIS